MKTKRTSSPNVKPKVSPESEVVKELEVDKRLLKIKKPKHRINLSNLLISKKEKDFFTEHLSMMLSAGMDVMSALSALYEETRSGFFKKIILEIKEKVQDGSNLWSALESSGLLSGEVISLIRVGEESGRLSENLKVVSIQQRKEQVFKSRLRSAMLYPFFVFGLTVAVGLGIAWFILPRLAAVFGSLDVDLPLITKILIQLGGFLGRYGYFFVPLVLIFILILSFFLFIFHRTKHVGQWILFHFPGVRSIIMEVQIARLGFILGTLLAAGLPILDALQALMRAVPFHMYNIFYQFIYLQIEEGKSFQESFANYKKSAKLIPIYVQQMIISGEQTGKLPETLINIGEIFEAKTDNSAKNLSVILEPFLLVIVAAGVLAVAVAVVLPIYSLVGELN